MSTDLRTPSQSRGKSRPQIIVVVAAAENDVIGRDNALPWHLPDDLKHFKAVTLGKPVIMGRKTYQSIGRPLPGRHNIVLSRAGGFAPEGVTIVSNFDAALQIAEPATEVVVIGGAALYSQALRHADLIYLTRVHADVAGDARMLPLDPREWQEVASEFHAADERHAYPFSFVTLRRRSVRG
ncbi:MAG: type 3 dihydrofolate reductase [Pseudomonadales bacterium]|nr:type 3 dihydrofolate reductase [Pseudomonadales bacterium]